MNFLIYKDQVHVHVFNYSKSLGVYVGLIEVLGRYVMKGFALVTDLQFDSSLNFLCFGQWAQAITFLLHSSSKN